MTALLRPLRTKLLGLAALALCSCASFTGTHPQGFAAYPDQPGGEWKAVSPEGVTWRIHEEAHEPAADLAFWKGALRKRMSEAGYRIVDSLAFSAGGKSGMALELSAPLGQTDYGYLVAAILTDKKLIVIEAAGPSAEFAKHRTDMLATLPTIVVK